MDGFRGSTCRIVGEFLQIIGPTEESPQLDDKDTDLLCHPCKLRLHGRVRLQDLVGSFEDQRLCGMKAGKI